MLEFPNLVSTNLTCLLRILDLVEIILVQLADEAGKV